VDAFLAEIRLFGGMYAPIGWEFCDGRELQISQYDALFTLIGTTYGGDGQTTFALPNLVSRIPFGAGSTNPVGITGGTESVTVTTQTMPAHSHSALASAQPGTSTDPAGKVWAAAAESPYAAAPAVQMDPATAGDADGGQPHENRPPFLALSFIICVEGLYPTQS
jgi:microcystin-dependent protein